MRSRKKNSTFLLQITASPSQLLLPNSIGGATFMFGAKIGLKSTKNVVFCILFRPMGRGCSPSGYATAVDQGRKYRLVFSSRYYILWFSVIDDRRLFALNFFLSIIAFSMIFAYRLSSGRIFILYFCSYWICLSLHLFISLMLYYST